MGNFYINHTVCGQDLSAVIQQLSGSEAYVSREKNGCFVIFDQKSEAEFNPAIEKLGIEFSRRPGARVLSVMIADDDIMMYWLFQEGKVVDTYNSNPGYDEVADPPRLPEGGDSSKLCSAFPCKNAEEVERVLRTPAAGGYVFEFERHKALTTLLGLPQEAIAVGFNYIQGGDFPQGFDASDFVPVPR